MDIIILQTATGRGRRTRESFRPAPPPDARAPPPLVLSSSRGDRRSGVVTSPSSSFFFTLLPCLSALMERGNLGGGYGHIDAREGFESKVRRETAGRAVITSYTLELARVYLAAVRACRVRILSLDRWAGHIELQGRGGSRGSRADIAFPNASTERGSGVLLQSRGANIAQ